MEILFNNGGNNPNGDGLGGGADLVKDSSMASFAADVLDASMQVPVIVDFWAPWCGPCKTLGPLLEKLVKQAKGAVRMVKINVDENQELAAQMRVQSIPAVYAFKDGRPVDGFVGAVPESQIKDFIQRLASDQGEGPGLDEALAEAKNFLAEGDAMTAVQIYQEVLHHDPANPLAFAGIMRAQIQMGQAAQAQELLAQLPDDVLKHAEVQGVKTALELASQAPSGEEAELRKRIAENADDHQARFDLAMAYYAAGEREAAVEELLDIIRRDREWNEDAARKQLIKLFEAFGPTDPLTVQGRKRLSRVLFS